MSIYDTKQAKKLIKVATEQATKELELKPDHPRDEGDPNHPMYKNQIFGYEQSGFLARQYI